MVCNFWLNRMTFGGFQVFKTDLRSMTKLGNSIKPNLSLHNMKISYFIACTILEAHQQYYHGLLSAKNCETYGDLCHLIINNSS